MSQQQLKYVAIVGGLLIPTYNFFYENLGGYLSYFCYLFFLTGYLKGNKKNVIRVYRVSIFMLCTFIIVGGIVITSIISMKTGFNGILSQLYRLHDSRNIITVIQAYAMFYIFIELKKFSYKWINEISKTALGSYLISESISIRGESGTVSILWNNIFHFTDRYYSNSFIWYSLLAIVITFIIVIIIDYLRITLMKHINIRIGSNIINNFDIKIKKLF